jgi:glycosyltransferase involved in cell wall biosynthesis
MAREEALGVACMEAMASGIPVIATNVGGLPEVLDNGNAAFMIPPNNAEALVDLLTYIEQNPVLISEKIQHGRIQIRKFDFLNLEQNLLRLFENLK